MQDRKKVAVAAGRVGATRKMTPRIRATHVQAQHRISRLKKGDTKPAQAFATTRSSESVQDNHQSPWDWRAIHEGQQSARTCGTTAKGWHWDLERLPLIAWQINGAERISQRLKITPQPGETLLKGRNPQLLQQLGVWDWIRPAHRRIISYRRLTP